MAVVQIKARFNKVQYHGGTMKRAFGIERERGKRARERRKTRANNKGGLLSMRHVVRLENATIKIMKN